MGIERIQQAFAKNHPAFMPYMMMGYPTMESSVEIATLLSECGADLLELGVPFSDPLADGAVIQAAGQRALANGMTLMKCLEQVRQIRSQGIQTPALLMSYVNPILSYGVQRCVEQAAQAGLDGFIVPDLPPEEAGEMAVVCKKHQLALVFLLSPNSPPERIQLAVEASRGFVYLVSLTGVTGARASLPEGLSDFLARVRRSTHLPLAVGFGISNPAQATLVAQQADGVIVGSALVRLCGENPKLGLSLVRDLALQLSAAVHAVGK